MVIFMVMPHARRWEKRTDVELGPFGFMKRKTTLKGWTAEGTVAWEECWWEASDWAGLRELGAHKIGSTPDGACILHTYCV